MQEIKITKLPQWVRNTCTAEHSDRARSRYILRIAATIATPEGSVRALSEMLGYHQNTLTTMLANGQFDDGLPVNMIKAIEEQIGRGVIPRQLMNPEVYDDQ